MSSDAEYTLDPEELDEEVYHEFPASSSPLRQINIAAGDLPYSSEDDRDSEEDSQPSPRRAEGGFSSPLKRPAQEDGMVLQPFKRQKGLLNSQYLDLLNIDIEDAAQRFCTEDDYDLPPSQLGLTYWSPMEKRLFFEALARLGRYNLAGIAARVGSKSVVEVHHYLTVLQQAQTLRRRTDHRPVLTTSEYPAAVELSQRCCHAQEEVADVISLKQERREQQREQAKWGGKDHWDIHPRLARNIDKGERSSHKSDVAFTQLFHLSKWLQLSDRIFMNSSIPGNNWSYVDEKPPSMWATAFEDFHSLAVSVTRRLVQTTLFISMSRIRAKSELIPNTKKVVHRKDVEAAIASLGMTTNSRRFWLESARRLRLEVFEEFPTNESDEDAEPSMSYDDVEAALAEVDGAEVEPEFTSHHTKEESDSEEEQLPSDEDEAEKTSDETGHGTPELLEDDIIKQEANEILVHSANDFPETTRARQALLRRIVMEREQEQHAELCDEYASHKAEAEMWEMLQKPALMPLPKTQDPGPGQLSNLDVESVYGLGRGWASHTRFYSEWETRIEPGTPEA